jgi:hypothetical protein
MALVTINPGTEAQPKHSVDNAVKIAEYICKDLSIDLSHFIRNENGDNDRGWYGFTFSGKGGNVSVEIPGIDPEVVRRGEPWVSPRLYVDGSSWLYGFALNRIVEHISAQDPNSELVQARP